MVPLEIVRTMQEALRTKLVVDKTAEARTFDAEDTSAAAMALHLLESAAVDIHSRSHTVAADKRLDPDAASVDIGRRLADSRNSHKSVPIAPAEAANGPALAAALRLEIDHTETQVVGRHWRTDNHAVGNSGRTLDGRLAGADTTEPDMACAT